jgi:predicted transcriptional regulator
VTGAVLMSIRPAFADELYRGAKLFEYRRVRARIRTGDRVLVYESRPRSYVSGEFRAGRVLTGPPSRLASLEPDPHVRALVERYLRGAARATAIEVLSLTRWDACVALSELSPGTRPPQSYTFL